MLLNSLLQLVRVASVERPVTASEQISVERHNNFLTICTATKPARALPFDKLKTGESGSVGTLLRNAENRDP